VAPDPNDPLAPEHVAAAIAPIIDRLRVSIARRVSQRIEDLTVRFELAPAAAQMLSMLRNTMPDRIVTQDHLLAVYAYSPPSDVIERVTALVQAGLIVEFGDDRLQLGDRGRQFLSNLRERTAVIIDDLWSEHQDLVPRLAELAEWLVASARETGGAAFGVMSPPYEPKGASDAMLLAERLTPLRFHRFDAHVAAWRAAGLDASEVQSLGPGALRDSIEDATNRRAGILFEVLTRQERFVLCTGVGTLPN